MRIQVLLVVLYRGMTTIPMHTDAIIDDKAGLSRERISLIAESEECQEILSAAGLLKKGDFFRDVTSVLVDRNLAYWNSRDRLVLTDGGTALLEHLNEYGSMDNWDLGLEKIAEPKSQDIGNSL